MNAPGRYWKPVEGGRVQCLLCHHRCSIPEGSAGICGVRRNQGGTLFLPKYGAVSSAAVDPIEKKPLYHFRPGRPVFSVGFTGCNLKCPFCQNWTISQNPDAPAESLSPDDTVRAALRARCGMIAYTYSEPLVHIEYILDCMRAARDAGLENVLVTNGHALPEPAREVLGLTDAANVDLKSWNPAWYARELGGDLPTVKNFLEAAAELTHLEVTTLVVPGRNDSEGEIRAMAEFLADLSPDIPYHLSAYRPMYKYDLSPTRPESLETLSRVAREKLRYVYLGNVPGAADTVCPACGAVLVHREGYGISIRNLRTTEAGRCVCGSCGAPSPILPP